jgi:hypothetical protein
MESFLEAGLNRQPNSQIGGSPEYRESRPTETLFCGNACPCTQGRRFFVFNLMD